MTGASQGIGAATARRMAAAGFDLRLVARSAQPLVSQASKLRQLVRRIDTCRCDLCDSAATAPAISDLCCRGFALNVSSRAAHNSFSNWGAYCAGKAALLSSSRCLATEACQHGVHVSCRRLGSVNIPLWDSETVKAGLDRHAMLAPEQLVDSRLFMARQPPSQTVEDHPLMPAAGAF